jgi:hypothetical protein
MALVAALVLVACAGSPLEQPQEQLPQLERVPVPPEIAKLDAYLEHCRPRVQILSPQPGEVLSERQVTVRFAVQGYPLFKDPQLGLGPHLHVVLDNRPYKTCLALGGCADTYLPPLPAAHEPLEKASTCSANVRLEISTPQ